MVFEQRYRKMTMVLYFRVSAMANFCDTIFGGKNSSFGFNFKEICENLVSSNITTWKDVGSNLLFCKYATIWENHATANVKM